MGDIVQPSNFNFAPQPRTAGLAPSGFAATNMMSEVDFERANTDIEDNEDEQSYYVEEEVTDEEAMELQRKELKRSQGLDESDDSDFGGYMPSILNKGDSSEKKKPTKITKKVRTKKKKTSSTKKPPR